MGSTRCQLEIRVLEHRSRIKRNIMEVPLTQHCLDKGHDFKDFRCIALEVLDTSNSQYKDLQRTLLQRETFWIYKLKSLVPKDLNQEMDYSVFL